MIRRSATAVRSFGLALALACMPACVDGGSGTESGGAAGAGATAGAGGAPPTCADPGTDCPAPTTTCLVAICDHGQCAVTEISAGSPCAEGTGKVCSAGACVECTDAAEHCPPATSECLSATCAAGACGITAVPLGTITESGQIAGDCKVRVCDGGGDSLLVEANDPTDDGNECTDDGCAGSGNVHVPVSGPCITGVCGDTSGPNAGLCVDCASNLDCAPPAVCSPAELCVEPTCADFEQNGAETGVDCGGGCPPCPNGTGCGAAADCESGACKATICAPCAGHADCADAAFCDPALNGGTCKPDLGVGAPCASAAQCPAGHCVDGYCCDGPCGAACHACSAAKKGAGPNGVCGPVKSGTDPDSDCPGGGPATCGETGVCGDGGQCQIYPAQTVCKPTSCAGSLKQHADLCDGAGTCVDGGIESCVPYRCNPAGTGCLESCQGDQDCTADNVCFEGACVPA